MIFIGLLAAFLIVFTFAACNVAHKYDEDCDHCAWGKRNVKK